jgi:hypothetical protein
LHELAVEYAFALWAVQRKPVKAKKAKA